MILASQIECRLPALSDTTETVVNCIMNTSDGPTPWEVGSAIANWGILLVAAVALIVSALSRRDAREAMETTWNENYKATQAQLDASREATRADLAERKNARELEITADFIGVIDSMFLKASTLTSDENRSANLREGADASVMAVGRFMLFVVSLPALREFQEQYFGLIQKFKPTKNDKFLTREYARLLKLHAALRSEVISSQKHRTTTAEFRMTLAALKQDDMEMVDRTLGLFTMESHPPNE